MISYETVQAFLTFCIVIIDVIGLVINNKKK